MLAFLLNMMCPWHGFGRKEELVSLRELDAKFLALEVGRLPPKESL